MCTKSFQKAGLERIVQEVAGLICQFIPKIRMERNWKFNGNMVIW